MKRNWKRKLKMAAQWDRELSWMSCTECHVLSQMLLTGRRETENPTGFGHMAIIAGHDKSGFCAVWRVKAS